MCVLTDMGVYPIWRSLMHGEAIEREGAVFSIRFGLLMQMVRARGRKIHVVLHENDRPILFYMYPVDIITKVAALESRAARLERLSRDDFKFKTLSS